jgi:eukaryotic-like serine/threonine-protein kinase
VLDSSAPSGRFDFSGQTIASGLQPGVEYQLRGLLGEGGMGAVYFALRATREGSSAVALKIINPDIIAVAGEEALLSFRKESVALGRLNEHTPPTPYVVRLLDTGLVATSFRTRKLELPWIALEHVHGGAEGTTLHDRVRHSRHTLGHAFAPERAASVLECVGAGLEAVHREGVIHRDLKPGNVLCAGFGTSEVFKISDFGIARPKGVDATFGNVLLGTPGYVAPEQSFADHGELGPWTDVFSFAALAFYVLAGENYFQAKSLPHAMMLATNGERRRLTDCVALSHELAAARSTCEEVDRLLAAATAGDPQRRPASALAFAQALVSTLRGGLRASARRSAPPSTVAPRPRSDLEWNVVHIGELGRVVRRAAWDGDGHCLALTSRGLEFWNGSVWLPCSTLVDVGAASLGVVAPISPGSWVLAGTAGRALLYRAGGGVEPLPNAKADAILTAASGDPDDLAVFVAHTPSAAPALLGMAGRRWMRPLSVPGVAAIADLTRISETCWLVCGAQDNGQGFACLYEPLMWAHGPLLATPQPLVACAAQAKDQAVAVGLKGSAVRVVDGHLLAAPASHPVDLWSVDIDGAGSAWAGAVGSLWRQTAPGQAWEQAFATPHVASAPFTSLFADVGRIVGMTRDGAVVEGRSHTAI